MAKKEEAASNEISELMNQIAAQLDDLTKLKNDELKKKNEDVKYMISYYNDLTDKIEDRRIRIHNFSLQMLAVSLAALAILVTIDSLILNSVCKIVIWYTTIIVFSILTLSCLLTSCLYVRQSSFEYPFLRMETIGSNQWKWFYYGNKDIQKINRNVVLPTKDPQMTTIPYLRGMEYFVRLYKSEDPRNEIRNNIQQLYLLQVHNYYKNKFYLQLTRIWEVSLLIVIVVIILGLLSIVV